LSTAGWTADEIECMTDHRWWEPGALAQAPEKIWPENLTEMLKTAGVCAAGETMKAAM
jgi:hypothetical protein